MTANRKELGRRIGVLRKSRHLSQQELAERLHISLSHIGKIEAGLALPSIDLCLELSNYFDVSTDYLLLGEEYKNESPKELLHQAMQCLSRLDKLY